MTDRRIEASEEFHLPSVNPPCHTAVANSEDGIRIQLYQAVCRNTLVVAIGIDQKECHVDESNRSCAGGDRGNVIHFLFISMTNLPQSLFRW